MLFEQSKITQALLEESVFQHLALSLSPDAVVSQTNRFKVLARLLDNHYQTYITT
jgi:hypothetical protein